MQMLQERIYAKTSVREGKNESAWIVAYDDAGRAVCVFHDGETRKLPPDMYRVNVPLDVANSLKGPERFEVPAKVAAGTKG